MRSLRTSCVQTVDSLRKTCGQFVALIHGLGATHGSLWKTGQFVRGLYTNCMQFLTTAVYNFTSVFVGFYTLSTWSTKPTTKYLYRSIV